MDIDLLMTLEPLPVNKTRYDYVIRTVNVFVDGIRNI
jgi:hypothetical protein